MGESVQAAWDLLKEAYQYQMGGEFDMATDLVSYLYLIQTPWALPLLFTPDLNAPAGTNIFWIDPVPWIALVGRAIYSATGSVVNLLTQTVLRWCLHAHQASLSS